ncbi:UNVERIFIED_CONTAM: hypothetical protein Sangu_3157200 [Sesamum angustifolium]|uniref:Retrotransposon gag domain-containing protein n=1 Tax=Sesamum angustifolium TaxID=2727405 RepID=A0AAW2JVN3_9LAMI
MADQGGINIRWEAMEARVRRLEELIGKPEQPPSVGLIQQVSSIQEMVESLRMKVKEELPETVLKGLESVSDEISCLTDAVDYKLESLKADLRLVKLAVANSGTDGSAVAPKVRVPDPKPFGGERSAKELENFLWDMETYFQAARVPDTEKVSITSMYLTGDAKLWWRSRLSDDASANRERIETWEVLKKELKDQFLPCNTSWLARESLRNLKHTGTVREFVKEFSSLMLDVRDMSEEDKLFNFMAGLKPWAQTELRRQGVKDLPTAIAAADRLGDYKVPNEPEQRSDDSGDGKAKFGKKFKKKDKVKEVMTETSELVRQRTGDWSSSGRSNAAWNVAGAVSGCGEAHPKGLVMVPGRINGKEIKALVDTGATHNFVSDRVVRKLGLDVRTWDSRVKAVNSKAVPVSGIADAELCVGGDKPSFVKGEYDGGTEAGKKSGVAEARSSNASSSKEGAQSPRLAGFSCIGTMQEEMHKRWTKAQQICGAEPETFTAKYFRGEGKHVSCVDEDVDISWWGWFVRPLKVQCGRHAHWTRQPVTTGVGTGICGSRQTVCWLVLVSWHGAGAQHMAHCWAGRGNGRVWCGQAARQGDVQAWRR